MNITLSKIASGTAATVLVLGASFGHRDVSAGCRRGRNRRHRVCQQEDRQHAHSFRNHLQVDREGRDVDHGADAPAPAKVVDGNGKKVPGIVTVWDPGAALATVATGAGKYLWNLDFASGEYNRMYMNRGYFDDSKGEYNEGSMYIDSNCTVPGVRLPLRPGQRRCSVGRPYVLKYDEDGYRPTPIPRPSVA